MDAEQAEERAILWQTQIGGVTVALEDSHNVVLIQGDRLMAVTDIEGMRRALSLALDERDVRAAVLKDAAQCSHGLLASTCLDVPEPTEETP